MASATCDWPDLQCVGWLGNRAAYLQRPVRSAPIWICMSMRSSSGLEILPRWRATMSGAEPFAA
ncbi:MAG TPA: hypothetical protein VHK70_04310 [Burkholderiaceae bacterium]|nr:hypothetical protein [Burkholderiaceae bacterium]